MRIICRSLLLGRTEGTRHSLTLELTARSFYTHVKTVRYGPAPCRRSSRKALGLADASAASRLSIVSTYSIWLVIPQRETR